LLRDEVIIRELNEEPSATAQHLSYLFVKKRLPEKRKKNEGKYHWHVLARQDQMCSLVGGVNFARLYGGFSGSKATTNL
jgi:hypothetical protein